MADRPAVTSVILGARPVEQLDDNLGAADLRLSEKETELLTEVSTPVVADYPYGAAGIAQRTRNRARWTSRNPTPVARGGELGHEGGTRG